MRAAGWGAGDTSRGARSGSWDPRAERCACLELTLGAATRPGGDHRGNPPAPAGWAPWGESVEHLGSQGAEPPRDQLRVPLPPRCQAGGTAPGSQEHPASGLPGVHSVHATKASHQGRHPSQAPAPRPAGASQPPTHTHTSRRRGQAKHAPGGPRAHGAAADRTCSKAAGRWAGRPASTAQGQAVEAAGQGERRFTLGEPFNPSECLPPHLKDGGNTACPRGSL